MSQTNETMESLKDRVKALAAPNREVDALIHIAIHPEFGARYDKLSEPRPEYVLFADVWRRNRADHINHANNVADWWRVPLYTSSVDAAMTLMPVGVNGLLGDRFRLKYDSVGTYGAGTTLRVDIETRG